MFSLCFFFYNLSLKRYFGGLKEDLKRSKFEPNQRCISESINSSPNYLTNGKTRILITVRSD